MKKREWVEMTAWVDASQREQFREKYNGCFSRFVRNAISMALEDAKFFQSVFFSKGGDE